MQNVQKRTARGQTKRNCSDDREKGGTEMNNLDDNVPVMLSINDVCKRTGLSRFCVRNLILSGEIKYFKSGAKYLVNFNYLCEYLKNGGVMT